MVGKVLDFVHDRSCVQQRLARNAADIEAHAAERVIAFDQHGLHAEIGAAERGGIAARPGAEHEHLAFDIGLARMAGRRWRRGRCRGRRGRRSGRWRGSRRRLGCFDDEYRRAFADLVADRDLQSLHDARMRGGNLHRRLVGFDHDETGFHGNGFADLDHDLDHGDILEIADVGHFHFDLSRHCAPSLMSEQHAPQIGEHIGEMHVETRGGGAVDDAVIP